MAAGASLGRVVAGETVDAGSLQNLTLTSVVQAAVISACSIAMSAFIGPRVPARRRYFAETVGA